MVDGPRPGTPDADGRGPIRLRALIGEGLHRFPSRAHALLPPEQRADLRHWLGRYQPEETGYPLEPPRTGPGESTGAPDFVGIGTQYSGAQWWYRLVTRHPGVFVRRDIPMARSYLGHFATTAFGGAEVARYHGWFPRRSGTIAGEWTPDYMACPWVAPLLAEAAPAARLLVMVRDPVERLLIGLGYRTDGQVSQIGGHIGGAVNRGYYASQLRRVFEFFPAEQVLVFQTERCAADPAGSLAATYRFLGLDDGHVSRGIRVPDQVTSARLPTVDPDTLGRLTELYAADVSELESLVPGFERSLWPAFA